jgi:hypothetical protein
VNESSYNIIQIDRVQDYMTTLHLRSIGPWSRVLVGATTRSTSTSIQHTIGVHDATATGDQSITTPIHTSTLQPSRPADHATNRRSSQQRLFRCIPGLHPTGIASILVLQHCWPDKLQFETLTAKVVTMSARQNDDHCGHYVTMCVMLLDRNGSELFLHTTCADS